ncbi:short-chain dehydrogenase/reductase family 9C member 7-like [Dermacentor variabilis]|uniref:short-chain dehydrogenase/reductase family 9C member 7-like n=1 Tax=Dermacentor variabilis TaxID=34621 RepID=UPI003F5BFA35
MRTSWILFAVFTLLFWDLWDRVPLLHELGSLAGSLGIILFASYCLSGFVWKAFFVKHLSCDGKAVLITGCDTGFGYALATRLSRDGFLVFAGCLDSKSEGAKALGKLRNVTVLQLDITKAEQVDAAFETVQQGLGSRVLWSVVANAGVRNNGLLEWLTMESIIKIFDVNVFGTLRVIKKFLPMLKKSKGRMVVVTSPFGHVTMPMGVPYCMTKCALVSMVDGLRRECRGKGVDFVSIEPIAYKTSITANMGSHEETQPELQQQPPEVVADYSAEEIQRWLDTPRHLYNLIVRDDINEVVDEMVLAIRETDPKIRYMTKFRLGGFLYYAAALLPTELADLSVRLGLKMLPFVSRMMRT